MNITMTWADLVLSLLIGVAGSLLAAYAYSRLPNISKVISRWFANRSIAAMQKRLRQLHESLVELQALKQDTSKYFGRMVTWLSDLLTFYVGCVLCFVLAVGITITIKLGAESGAVTYLRWMMFGGAIGLILLANVYRRRLFDYRNLDKREDELRDEIEIVKAKLADQIANGHDAHLDK